jgi:hypothetical protein
MLVVPSQKLGGRVGHITLPFHQEDLKERQSNSAINTRANTKGVGHLKIKRIEVGWV